MDDAHRTDRQSLEQFAAARAKAVGYGDGVLCRVLGDLLAIVDPADLAVGPRLAMDGYWEAWVTAALLRHLRPGMACVDVGAHVGYYTLAMARAVGPEGRVLAVEPYPVSAHRLRQNLALNGFSWVETAQVAASDAAGTATLRVPRCNVGGASLHSADKPDYAEECEVPTIALDDLLGEWTQLDLVKVDVEGWEGKVWQGTERLRQRFPGSVLVVELHVGIDRRVVADLLPEIERGGYVLRHVRYDGTVAPITPDAILSRPESGCTLWLTRR
jgi:FkbM family methyltransferase